MCFSCCYVETYSLTNVTVINTKAAKYNDLKNNKCFQKGFYELLE